MKKLLAHLRSTLTLFILCIFAYSAYGQIDYSEPKEYEVVDIAVEGAEFSDKFAIVVHSGLRVGDKISVPGEELAEAGVVAQRVDVARRTGIVGDPRRPSDGFLDGGRELRLFLPIGVRALRGAARSALRRDA